MNNDNRQCDSQNVLRDGKIYPLEFPAVFLYILSANKLTDGIGIRQQGLYALI